MNDSIIFKIQQETVQYAACRGDDQSSPFCEKQHRIDDDQRIKYRVNASDAACYEDEPRNQNDIAQGLDVNVRPEIADEPWKEQIDNGKDICKQYEKIKRLK
jgi:hypothetical protein